MASDIWLRTILIVRKETRCRHIGYSYRLTARVLLYAPSHRQDNTYHGLCYTSRGALAGTRNRPNESPKTTKSAVGAITDTRNILIYMDINTTAPQLWNKLQKMGRGGGGELLISEITWSGHDYTVIHKKMSCLFFITSHLSFECHSIYYTNTGSNQITGIYWPQKNQHFITTGYLSHITNGIADFVKKLYQMMAAPCLMVRSPVFDKFTVYVKIR